jgi:hypothetical protein
MLTTHLNMLSAEKKRHLQRVVIENFIKSTLELCVFFLIIVSIALLGGRWVLESYYADITSRIVALNSSYSGINSDVSRINQSIASMNALNAGLHTPWHTTLSRMTSATPEHITLSRLALSQKNKRYDITGVALDRAALLSYVELLRDLPEVASVSVPLSELTARERIPFALAVTLK